MKIGVISSTVFSVPIGGYGGLEAIAYHCAKGLASRGHQVALFAPDGSSCEGCEVVQFGPPGRIDERSAYSRYWQMLPNCDVVIAHDWQKWAYCLKAEGNLKAPVLGVLHAPVNTMYQTIPPKFEGLPPVEKPCFVCISDDQKAHFEALFGRPARRAYNGIDLDFYKPIETPRSNRFLFLARFSSIKGPDLAIQACKEAGVGLDMIGDTTITNEPELYHKCMSMCDGEQIRMIGNVSRAETIWWYSQAHCMIHPNQRFREPFGLAPVEAMACGSPVISWDHGAMRETQYHCENFENLIASYDDLVVAVMSASNHYGITSSDRERCRERASKFSIDNMIQGYEALCYEALSKPW